MYFWHVLSKNCEPHLKRVLIVARYGDITTHNFHTLDSVQLDAAFLHGLFLKEHDLYFMCAVHTVDMIQIIVSSQEATCTDPASRLYNVKFKANVCIY